MSGSTKIIQYQASTTGRLFHASRAFVRGIMGPVGSGKSVTCVFDVFNICQKQEPGDDGVRRTRVLVVRNTLPQLETTTIKTWLDWFPEDIFGRITRKPPYTQVIQYRLPDGTMMHMEVIFLALDKPEDVKKLLSLECTLIWFNEAREMEKEIVDAGTARVGRYPSVKDRPSHLPDGAPWPTFSGIIMDTNPPDDSHWWFKADELQEWRLDPSTNSLKPLDEIPDSMKWEFWRQPSGLSSGAENVENLPSGYYDKISVGKSIEWIDVYVHGKYGFVMDGLPVFKNSYNPSLHVAEKPLAIDPYAKVIAGIDCSGRNPAAIFLQVDRDGQMRAVWEFVCEGIGAELFGGLLRRELNAKFPKNDIEWWGDPAGFFKQNTDERTYVDILRAKAGITVRPSPVLRSKPRIEAMESVLLRLIPGGRPALLVSPECKMFVRGLAGGYKYKRLQISGGARYTPEPDKTERFADIHDAAQYAICGMGEYKRMVGRDKNSRNVDVGRAVDLGSKEWNI